MRRGEVSVEVGYGDALATVELVLDMNIQRWPRPAVLDDLSRIPFALAIDRNLGEECDEVEPRQLGSRLLPNQTSGTLLSEVLHVLQVAAGEALHLRKGFAEIGGEAFNHLGSPALLRLPFENLGADLVIEPHQFLIDGDGGALSGTGDPRLQAGQPIRVVPRDDRFAIGHG
jgi:hypothetical protein